MMNGKEKLYFLLERIVDQKDIVPNGKPLIIDPANDLNRKYREIELVHLFTKLESDEKVLTVLKSPHRTKDIDEIEELDPYGYADDGCWHIKLLPNFENYYLRIQHEPEYQEFTGKKPSAPIRTKLSRKSLEKIWTVLQEIEDKRGITSSQDDISIPFVHFSKVKDETGAVNASDERRNILRKLKNEEQAIKDVRFPNNLKEYVYLRIGSKYFETLDYYEKEYKEAAKNYLQEQQAQQALRPVSLRRNETPSSERVTAREIADEFSSKNYSFVLMVLKQIASLNEFSVNNRVSYQLQSSPGQFLIQERSLLEKLQSKGLFRNHGEDGIFAIATLSNVNNTIIKEVIDEIEKRSSLVTSSNEKTYTNLLDSITKPHGHSLEERYDNLLKEVKEDKQQNNANKIQPKPEINKNSICEWSDDFNWKGNKQFTFGKYGEIGFTSKLRIDLFRELTKAKGGWVTVKKLKDVTGKDEDFVRPTIGQIERSMKIELRKYISIPSTNDDDLEPKPIQGAYRIKFTRKPL